MTLRFGKKWVVIPCPKCGQTINDAVERINPEGYIVCPSCNNSVLVASPKLRCRLESAKECIDKIRGFVKRLFK